MKITSHYLSRVFGLLIAGVIFLNGIQTVSGFTALDRAACWSAWTNAFYFTSGGRGYFRVQEGNNSPDWFWLQGAEIEVVNKAVEIGLADTNMVNALCSGFTNSYGLDWSWNTWNDDVSGAARAFVGAYEVTGNRNWLQIAKYGFDLGYSRGFEPLNGGVYEFVCSNNCLEATETTDGMLGPCYLLSKYLPDPSYLTKAQNLYGYLVTNTLVASTGMVQGTPNSGVSSTATSDYGFLIYDSLLFSNTNNAKLVASYVTNHWGFLLGGVGGSPGYCLRAMGMGGIQTAFAQQACDNAWSWRNSRGLVGSWSYRMNDTNKLNCYDAMQIVMGMMSVPPSVPPTLPVTAADAVGGQVTFTTMGFGVTNLNYQWQVIRGLVTNNILGATNSSLTLSNLQLADAASYQLRASNSLGVLVSIPASLKVSTAPAPVNNVISSFAAQTGQAYGFAFTPTWTVAPGSLIAGKIPNSTNGNFNLEPYYANRNVNSLTAGGALTITPQGANNLSPNNDYATYTVTFTATAPTETLSFIGTDLMAVGDTVFIDNVRIVSIDGLSVNVPDSGFETPAISGHQYNPSGAPWTFSGSSPSGSGILGNGSAFGNPNAPEGVQAAFVQGHGVLSQPISGLVPGTTYTITYSAAQRSGNSQTWLVTIGDLPTPPGSGAFSYTNYSISFTATAATETLAFAGTDLAGGDNTVFIDNVRIVSSGGLSVTVPNFSFETPVVSSHQYNPSGGSWTFSGTSPSGSGIVRNGGAFGNPASPQGVQAAFLQRYGTISQAISGLIPGTNYTLSFSASQRSGNCQSWNVTMNGAVIGNSAFVLGSRVITGNNYVTCGDSCGAGSNLTYTLPASASGYVLTNITVYGGWACNERDSQAYTVYYSTVAAPSNFILLGSVNYNPANTNYNPFYQSYGNLAAGVVPAATRTSLTAASGALATNVAAVMFDFTSPSSGNGYSGYAQIGVYGAPLSPMVATNTLPATAADVVGSQVTFTAAFTAINPLTYQWQKISGGATNNMVGATNTILTFTSLQLSDTASYRLVASNADGMAYSTPSSLTVSSVPTAVNNVVTAYAAQTGFGSTLTNFVPTWTITPGSLIAGQSPSSVGSGNFSQFNAGVVSVLTDGSFGWLNYWPGVGSSPSEVTCGTSAGGAGRSVTYTLAGSTNGYTLTNIVVYGGWGDAGRDQQAYTISYSTIAAPSTFVSLTSANYNPVNPSGVQSATRANFKPVNGVLATNVSAIKFDFTTPAPENGYCGYSEIDVYGLPTKPPVATNPTNIVAQFAANILTLSWPGDHLGWRLQVQTNDLNRGLDTNWWDVDGSTLTNQFSTLIFPNNGSTFYRIVYP